MLNTFLTWIATGLGKLQRPTAVRPVPVAQALAYETQSLPETLARIAESQVGVREQGGNNKGPEVQAYQSATWLTGTGWAWCAAFVDWCLWQTLQTLALTPKGWKRPRTAGAYDLENWARGDAPHSTNKGWTVFKSTPQTPPKRGDIITFNWPHVGIVTAYDPSTKRVSTVEGNAGAKQTSDQASGDGVVAKTHHVTVCRRLIRYMGEGK